ALISAVAAPPASSAATAGGICKIARLSGNPGGAGTACGNTSSSRTRSASVLSAIWILIRRSSAYSQLASQAPAVITSRLQRPTNPRTSTVASVASVSGNSASGAGG